jgi:hypothetical protein
MNLEIGNEVRWESAAGVLYGTIKNIVLAPAANDQVTPWIDVEYSKRSKLSGTVRLCASDSSIKMLKISKVKVFNHAELHVELTEIVRQYSTGLLTDLEILAACDTLRDLYSKIDLSKLCDPNTGLRYPEGSTLDSLKPRLSYESYNRNSLVK